MKPPAIILAGGLARRMGGGDKPLKPIAGQPLLDRVIARLAPQSAAIAINANGDAGRFARYGLPVRADPVPGHPGPLAGVLAGLDWAAEAGFDRVVTVAGDTPFFPHYLAAALNDAIIARETPIAMAATPDPERGLSRHPTFAVWFVSCRDAVRAALDEDRRKVIAVSDPLGCATCVFDGFAYDPFFNVNTPDDMAEAERMVETFGL